MKNENKFDVYQMVTDKIIERMEKDGIIPWRKPWVITSDKLTQFNPNCVAYSRNTGKPYSLLNQMMLGLAGEWATAKQIMADGGKIKKGEKASQVVFWKMDKKVVKDSETDEEKTQTYFILRYYNVFHVATQCEGIEPKKIEIPTDTENPFIGDGVTDEFINTILKSEKAWKFSNVDADRACYIPALDTVQIPHMKNFKSMNHYYSTLFHEFTHATGAKSRLDRDMSGRFGSSSYAKEELCAEIGSSFMTTLLGLETDATEDNTIAYLQSWIKALKEDNKLIVHAASKAQHAIDYMLEMAEIA